MIVLCFVVRYFMPILVLQSFDGEKRAGCCALFVILASCDCCVALPCDAMGLSAVCDCGISILRNFESFKVCAEHASC